MTKNNHQSGLSSAQAEANRIKFGSNVLTPPQKDSLWVQFLEKFEDPIIRILLIAMLLSLGVSMYQYFTGTEGIKVLLEPLGIFVAVLLATCVGFAFELSANKKFDLLNKVNDETAVRVIRDGNVTEIEKKDVVTGDIVVLESGEEVPADGELLEAISLQVNESDLTGEPVVRKSVVPSEFDTEATYPTNQIFRGSSVVDGHAIMQVTKVGDATEYGKVYEGAQIDNKIKTPLNEQLDKLGDTITTVSYILAAIIIVARIGFYFLHNESATINWMEFAGYSLNTLMIAVTVIVVAVPEGLPMSVTLSLALSMKRMLSTNNLVRKMHACETMGASTVICTDKTGTLTQNQMKVSATNIYGLKEQILSEDDISMLVKEGIAVNSTAHLNITDQQKVKTIGNPTESALLLWLHQQQQDYRALRENAPVCEQLTFSTERKFMATVVESPLLKKRVLYVKGAPEIVLSKCNRVLTTDGLKDTNEYRPIVEEQLVAYQNQAMRTLGFAYQILDDNHSVLSNHELNVSQLTYLGIAAISDPVRKEVPAAIQHCMEAGIQVKIVTGDTPGTAREIGRQIGLWKPEDEQAQNHHITGEQFAALSDEVALDRVESLKIISRARPMDKERLVRLLQQRNQVVAVTGDGTNDAPALNAAQVGLSMGDGTSVAKEASAITILDNSFHSITRAVMWGRSLYLNIQRFILFQMTINVVACLIVLLGAFLGTESPLTVTQMLWVNLIMDTFAALALASLPPDERVMSEQPRRRGAYIISKPMAVRILGVGVSFVILLFGFLQYFKHETIQTLADFSVQSYLHNFLNFTPVHEGLSAYELSLFFTLFVFLQFWNMFNAKAYQTGKSAFRGMSDPAVLKGFLIVALIIAFGQYLIVTFGGEMFNVVPLKNIDWIILFVGTSPVLLIGEFIRLIKK
ncbi:MAG: calcium-translocating P-type ATPase, PMCA-type [Bacteroidales bacterium]